MGISLHILPTTNAPTFSGASPDISESITTHSCICIREDILHIHKCSLHLTTHTTLHMASPHVLQPYLTTSHHTPYLSLTSVTSPHRTALHTQSSMKSTIATYCTSSIDCVTLYKLDFPVAAVAKAYRNPHPTQNTSQTDNETATCTHSHAHSQQIAQVAIHYCSRTRGHRHDSPEEWVWVWIWVWEPYEKALAQGLLSKAPHT